MPLAPPVTTTILPVTCIAVSVFEKDQVRTRSSTAV
jgi:hypothetical protein